MPADTQRLTPPQPTVFISYASADRIAARTLRDVLVDGGLEVWLDEDELAGGEAWDTKIRNQIRTCTYFMPVISATTEARREGYFRREWRLAVERTLDLADDVLFLAPVVIDDTRDVGARVPERFFAVQWLRVPGGRSTPALQDLAKRLARGEAVSAPAAPLAPAAAEPARGKSRRRAEPPPFPKFPAFPEQGHRLRFCYELVVWFGHLLLTLWGHLPRVVRVIAACVIIGNLIAWVFRVSKPEDSSRPAKSEVAAAVDKVAGLAEINGTPEETSKTEAVIQSLLVTASDAIQSGRPVTLVVFGGTDEVTEKYAEAVYSQVCGLLKKDGKSLWGVSPLPLKPDASDAEIVRRGLGMKSRLVVTGHASTSDREPSFEAKVYDVNTGQLLWTETFYSGPADADKVAERIAAEITKRLTTPAHGTS